MDIDLNRLQIFKELALAGSFTRAAAKLRQPKSRVSRQLAALEKELGVALVSRTTRQVQLTPAGRDLFERALPHLGHLEAALEEITAGAEAVAGPIRLSVPDDLGVEIMGPVVHSFVTLYPDVSVHLHVSNQVVDLVRDGFDFAVRVGRLRDSTLLQRRIGEARLVPVISPTLRARHGDLSRPAELARVPYLSFDGLLGPRGQLRFRGPRGEETVVFKPTLSANNFFFLRSLAVRGAGFAVLPPFVAREAFAAGTLVPALRDWEVAGAPIQVVYPRQAELPVRGQKFLAHLTEQLRFLG